MTLPLLPPVAADRAVKRRRVLQLLDAHDADAVTLVSAPAVNWYLDGARTHVSLAAAPIVAVEIDRFGDRALVTSNEGSRLIAEELPADVDVVERDWWEPVAYRGLPELAIGDELRAVRGLFLPAERRRFDSLGAAAAEAVTDAVQDARPDLTEYELAARVAGQLVEHGLEPLVVLVGGASRGAIRHPLPTAALLGRRAMIVVCARRWGLVANLTRWIRFEAPTDGEEDRDRRILEVEADAFAATRAGEPLNAVLDSIRAAYPRHGFSKHEFAQHHQGGLAGYDGRDPRATPVTIDRVPPSAYVAWNPSAPDAKAEDTVVIDAHEVRVVTHDDRWPTTDVRGVARPSVLQL